MEMVTQLQAQVEAMGTRMEQQQLTITELTSELQRRAAAAAAADARAASAVPRSTPAVALASTVPVAKPLGDASVGSNEALRAAVLAATEEERLLGDATIDLNDDDDDDADADVRMLAIDMAIDDAVPFAQAAAAAPSDLGGASTLGADVFAEVPCIVFEPDADDDEPLAGYDGDELTLDDEDVEDDDDELEDASLAVPARA